MTRRGVTLLELLLALTLLGSLGALLTGWVTLTVRLSHTQMPLLHWCQAAERVLDLIEDDLACGDFPASSESRGESPPWEIRGQSRLSIVTRSANASVAVRPGQVRHEYQHHASTQQLTLTVSAIENTELTEHRILLDGVDAWQIGMAEEERVLVVQIAHASGTIVVRRYPWD